MTEPALPYAGTPPDQLDDEKLAAVIAYHNHRYFVLDQPVISDAEFDRLVDLLRRRRPDHPVLQQVGAAAGTTGEPGLQGTPLEKVTHRAPMLSLEKCNTPAEFYDWLKGACALLTGKTHGRLSEDEVWAWSERPEARLLATPKIDGLACSLVFGADGRLKQAATRGDGTVGENVTHNAKRIPGLGKLQHAPGHEVEVRGEVYLPLREFREVADQFMSPRNLAAGMLKSKENPALPPERLRFFAYDVQGPELGSEEAKLELARKLGIDPAPFQVVAPRQAEQAFRAIDEGRAEADFELDGVVLKFAEVAVQQRLGVTSHHPRGAIAWKFAADMGITTLVGVEWSVSRTGTITPVAIVAPVQLSGASVTRATLHNLSNLRRLALKIGDSVEIVRRGGVIPHLENTRGGGHEEVAPPETCPSCGGPTRETTSDKGGKITQVLMCAQPEKCGLARHGQILHYCAALEMEGFGDKVIDVLLERGLINDPADLYTLQAGDLELLPRFGKVMTANLLAQVDKARTVELAAFLRALGVESLGKHAAALLATRWDLEQIRQLSEAEVASLHSLGDKIAQNVVQGLKDRADLIDRLLQHVRVVRKAGAEPTAGPLAGQVIVFTGALQRMGRRDAQQTVVRLGGLAGDSVTSDTTLLVVGGDELTDPNPSSKLKKARKLFEASGKPEIVAEADFWARIAEGA